MEKEKILDRLLEVYRQSFDIEQPCTIADCTYDAYGAFRVTNSKYVLTKKTELWRAECFEHIFFRLTDTLTEDSLSLFRQQLTDYIEPELVRHKNKYPPQDHMYTYLTGVFICENGISPELSKKIRHFRFSKNYLMTIRGYCDARLVVIDLVNRKLYGNPAARELINGYKKMKLL